MKTALFLTSGILSTLLLAPTAISQPDGPVFVDVRTHPQIDILVRDGYDHPDYSHDDQCDDSRFDYTDPDDTESWRNDASDCHDALKSGATRIDFGYWVSGHAKRYNENSKCDDPRFDGADMGDQLMISGIRDDALDCKSLFLAGRIRFSEVHPLERDDVCQSRFQHECDWFSFESRDVSEFKNFREGVETWEEDKSAGEVRIELPIEVDDEDEDVYRPAPEVRIETPVPDDEDDVWSFDPSLEDVDALSTDEDAELRKKFGDISDHFREPERAPNGDYYPLEHGGLILGDDKSDYAFDQECDDPRFEGMGMGANVGQYARSQGHDASDCLARLEKNDIWPAETAVPEPETKPVSSSGPDFGDDASPFAHDGKCHDNRFFGSDMAEEMFQLNATVGHDASDCRALWNKGWIGVKGLD